MAFVQFYEMVFIIDTITAETEHFCVFNLLYSIFYSSDKDYSFSYTNTHTVLTSWKDSYGISTFLGNTLICFLADS